MPNWNYNSVTIDAPINKVKKYLVYPKGMKYAMFNMHLLYPKIFSVDDLTGLNNRNGERALEHTGTRVPIAIESIKAINKNKTGLSYKTAYWPNTFLLERWHKLTGWGIRNYYTEPLRGVRGKQICCEGICNEQEEPIRWDD